MLSTSSSVAPISKALFLLLEKERTKKKQKGAYSRDRNREGEKLALANQHISAIVFVIKLQHQADIERDKENKRSKKDYRQGKQERGRLISNRTPLPPADQVSGFYFFILLQLISIYTVQVNFNSLAQCSNTRALKHACCSAQPGHWLGPVTVPGWLSPAHMG
jgi:hypothetical protein